MINDIKDTANQHYQNPQRFSNIKCKIHPDQQVAWVSLENDRENKLLCNICIIKEKEIDPTQTENIKRPSQVVDYKVFLKNIHLYNTLDDNDPERFSTEIIKCLEGAKQPEKLKQFMTSVGQIKSEVKKEFQTEFVNKLGDFQKEMIQKIEKIKQTFLTFTDEQLDQLFSRETLQIKQFKEKGCKVILSAAKSVTDDVSAFENLQNAISKLHSGKFELNFAREHGIRIYKSLLVELENKIFVDSLESLQKIIYKQTPEIQASHQFLPKKQGVTRPNNFSNLNQNYTQSDMKTKRESFTSISELAKADSKRSINIKGLNTPQHQQHNSLDQSKKSGQNSFIIKPVPQVNSNTKREQYRTQNYNKQSDDNITLQLNLKTEIMNTLPDGFSPKHGVSPKYGNIMYKNMNTQQTTFSKLDQQLKQQNQPAQFAVFNHQKNQSSQDSMFKDNNNFLQIPNGLNINGTNSNNKQQITTSLFSSFSSTLRTKSTTSIQVNNQQMQNTPATILNQNDNGTNSNTPQQGDKFNRKINTNRKNSAILNSQDNLQIQQQQQNIGLNEELTDRSGKYYIRQPSNKGQTQFSERKKSPKSGSQLSPFPKDLNLLINSGLNTSDKNLSLTNNSQNQQHKQSYEQEFENALSPIKKQTNKLHAYTNQVKSGIQGNSQSQPTSPSLKSGGFISRTKNNILKNNLITNKQTNQDNSKFQKDVLLEKPFKYNLLSIVRIPNQASGGNNHDQNHSSSQSSIPGSRSRRMSPDQQGENRKNSPSSNSPPKDGNLSSSSALGSSGRIEEIGNFLLASPDGYLSLFNVQERTHTKLNSVAIGRTGNMFFTAGESSKTTSIKLWIFHSHKSFSELVELKMADSNIKKIFFIKEEYASRLNKLSFAIWTQTILEPNKQDKKISNDLGFQTVNKVGIWILEFAGNKFEGAKMFSVSNVELPLNALSVSIKDEEMMVYTKNTLTLYALTNNNTSIQKKVSQKFTNIVNQDTICCVRSYQQSKHTSKNYFVFSKEGCVITLNENLNIIQQKNMRDLTEKYLSLYEAIIYEPECDFPENNRFFHFFKKDNSTLYVFDLEYLRVVDEIQSNDEIKNIFFYGSGYYLGFEQFYVRIWKPLPQKQEIVSHITTYDS